MPIDSKPFGTLPTGEQATLYTLSDASGASVSVTDYGGIITAIRVPDRSGELANVTLGHDCVEAYIESQPKPYFGCITGRVAGRITAGKFSLDGVNYELALTDAPNHLHGGEVGFDQALWSAELTEEDGLPTLHLGHTSPDGDQGYPGELAMVVTYQLRPTEGGVALSIRYQAETDKATPITLTNHTYFNLTGAGSGDVLDHTLQIEADDYAPTDDDLTLQGRREAVVAGVNDFRTATRLGDQMKQIHAEHGDHYFFRGGRVAAPRRVVTLASPASGRVMETWTTEPGMQFYAGKFLPDVAWSKDANPFDAHGGLCLETQEYPDAVNSPELGDLILKPERVYTSETVYAFGVEK